MTTKPLYEIIKQHKMSVKLVDAVTNDV